MRLKSDVICIVFVPRVEAELTNPVSLGVLGRVGKSRKLGVDGKTHLDVACLVGEIAQLEPAVILHLIHPGHRTVKKERPPAQHHGDVDRDQLDRLRRNLSKVLPGSREDANIGADRCTYEKNRQQEYDFKCAFHDLSSAVPSVQGAIVRNGTFRGNRTADQVQIHPSARAEVGRVRFATSQYLHAKVVDGP